MKYTKADKQMQIRNREETINEIMRVRKALKTTTSQKLTRDYRKYLQRLERDLREYDGTIYIECRNKRKFG